MDSIYVSVDREGNIVAISKEKPGVGKKEIVQKFNAPEEKFLILHKCSNCNRLYDHVDGAKECCGGSSEETFRCNSCGTDYDSLEDAADCCSSVSLIYRCPECGETYDDDNEASGCCCEEPESVTICGTCLKENCSCLKEDKNGI
jgi:hypothetical protein